MVEKEIFFVESSFFCFARPQGVVISKMMGHMELNLFEAMFPSRFQIVGVFQPKNGQKGNFLWKNREFSM